MNTIKPTVGRIVLFQTEDTNGKQVTLPAIVTHVHSDDCISLVAFSAFSNIAGLLAGGTRPVTSVLYDERQQLNTWRWMPVQAAGGGFDARIKALEETLAALNAKQPATQRLPVADNTPIITP